MSDRKDPDTSAVQERTYFRWIPVSGAAAFREELDEVRAVPIDLKEVYIETPASGGEPDLIRLTFEVEPAVYRQCERNSWFGLKPGLAQGMGFEFDPKRPIRLVARVDDDTLEATILPDFDPDDPGEAIKELIAPLYDEDEFGIESPLGYQYESVIQETDEGGIGFTPETVEDFERTEGPIPLPREMFMPAEEIEEEDEYDMAGVQFFEKAETVSTATAETMTRAVFKGPFDIEGTLKQVKMTLGGAGLQRVALVVEVDYNTYTALDYADLFGLTDDSKGPNMLDEFDPDLPVELTLVLKPDLLRERFVTPELEPVDAVELIAEVLETPEGSDRLRDTEAYVYQSVMQQPRGYRFSAGFKNRNLD